MGVIDRVNQPKRYDMTQPILAVLLFSSLVFPTALVNLKLGLLSLYFIFFFLNFGVKRVFRKSVILASLTYSIIGLIWSIYGVVAGNPGALQVLSVMFIYPILFTVLGGAYRGQSDKLHIIFIASGVVILILDGAYLFGEVYFTGNLLTDFLKEMYRDNAVVDNASSYFKFTLPNVASLLFLLPYLFSSYLFGNGGKAKFVLLSLLSVLALLSGRRALLLFSFVGPITAYCITCGAPAISRKSYFRIIVLSVVLLLFAIIFSSYWPEHVAQLFMSMLDFTSNNSNQERNLQFQSLIHGFLQSPILGNGAGAVASYLRSEEIPWAYELLYVALLFQYGLIGFSLYFFGIFSIVIFLVYRVRMLGRNSFEFYYLSGFISFVLASSTNPYLSKFDYMWVIFIPVALYNFYLQGFRK